MPTAFGLFVRGLVLGSATGVIGLLAPPLGLLFAVVGVLFLARTRPGFWAPAGMLIGAGFAWLFLLWRSLASCQTIQTPDYYADCRPPDLGPYIDAAGVFIVVGSVLLIVAFIVQHQAGRRRSELLSDSDEEKE